MTFFIFCFHVFNLFICFRFSFSFLQFPFSISICAFSLFNFDFSVIIFHDVIFSIFVLKSSVTFFMLRCQFNLHFLSSTFPVSFLVYSSNNSGNSNSNSGGAAASSRRCSSKQQPMHQQAAASSSAIFVDLTRRTARKPAENFSACLTAWKRGARQPQQENARGKCCVCGAKACLRKQFAKVRDVPNVLQAPPVVGTSSGLRAPDKRRVGRRARWHLS